jgi:alpha/beta superfamily hydrolase
MHNKVVFRMARAFFKAGFVALRFNFRGVGKSAGKHDNGRGEQDDLVAAIDFAERSYPGAQIWLGGFSFGASVVLKVGCRDWRVRALVAAGAPVSAFGFEPIDGCEKDKLVVQGSLDQFGPVDVLRSFFEQLAEPKRLVVIDGSGHFFEGHLDELEGAISNFICRLSA